MPLPELEVENFAPYYLKAKKLIVEDIINVLIVERNYKEASRRLHDASMALEKAAVLIYRMHLRKEDHEIKRNSESGQ